MIWNVFTVKSLCIELMKVHMVLNGSEYSLKRLRNALL